MERPQPGQNSLNQEERQTRAGFDQPSESASIEESFGGASWIVRCAKSNCEDLAAWTVLSVDHRAYNLVACGADSDQGMAA